MGRPLVAVQAALKRELDECRAIAHRSVTVRDATSSRLGFTRTQQLWMHELCLLKATRAWETYLEHSLAHYVLGHRAPHGRLFARTKHFKRVSIKAVKQTFTGDNEWVSWIEYKAVRDRATEWLRDGEPFTTALGSAGAALGYVKVLRNAIAHDSDSVWEKFDERTRILYGSVPRNATPGSQLLLPPAPSFGLGSTALLEGLITLFGKLSDQITP
jgi:hypothetical protein